MWESGADGKAVAGHSSGRAAGESLVDDRFAALREVVSGRTDAGRVVARRS